MPDYRDDSAQSAQKGLRGAGRAASLRGDERGAVLLLCLAAFLILLLVSWVLVDAIFVTVDKQNAQQSADTAAFSQASVEARAMNMVAFTNVAKRSLVGVHTVYESMFVAYEDWIYWLATQCAAGAEVCDKQKLAENLELYGRELDTDYSAYENNEPYYFADLRALDNYQRHLVEVTPWWAFSEAVLRAQRNGATLATSFPPPPGYAPPDAPRVLGDVVTETGGDSTLAYNISSGIDRLPVERADYESGMVEHGMVDREVFADPAARQRRRCGARIRRALAVKALRPGGELAF